LPAGCLQDADLSFALLKPEPRRYQDGENARDKNQDEMKVENAFPPKRAPGKQSRRLFASCDGRPNRITLRTGEREILYDCATYGRFLVGPAMDEQVRGRL